MESGPASVAEFSRRKKTFMLRGLLPVLLIVLCACLVMAWALPTEDNLLIFLSNMMIFLAGMVYVITAKRYYRCPVCEKVVVPTKSDGTPSEISFGIAYKPKECPYCRAQLG